MNNPPIKPMNLERLDRVNKMMQQYVDQKQSAGMVAIIHYQGETVLFNSCGMMDIDSARPMNTDTLFRIYSMTKPITSVALMTLLEQGKFHLDDSASHWIPTLGQLKVDNGKGDVEDQRSAITIRHLLTHCAGFSYGFDPDNSPIDREYQKIWRFDRAEKTIGELLEETFDLPLIAQPGSKWHYSIATDICGHLIEVISDMSLGEYLEKTIFTPLGMIDTSFTVPESKLVRFATLYGANEDGDLFSLESDDSSPFFSLNPERRIKCQSGGGGLVSTASDYLCFARMMLNFGELDGNRILGRKTVEWMTRNHLPVNLLPLSYNGIVPQLNPAYGFGLGYAINIDPTHAGTLGSKGDYGWGGLADCYHWVDPKEQLIGILMQQFMPSLYHPGRRDFRNAVYQAIG